MELVLRCLLLLDVLGVKVLGDCGITPTSDADEERWTRRAGRGCPERGLPYNRTIRCPEAETPKSYIGLDIYIILTDLCRRLFLKPTRFQLSTHEAPCLGPVATTWWIR